MLDRILYRVSSNDRTRKLLTPLVRGYFRYGPVAAGKWTFWNRVLDPYFAWYPYRFEARTLFGSRLGGTTPDLIQTFVYYFGLWEPQLTHWLSSRLAPADVFVDVGANVGYFSLLGSRCVGKTGSVVAIEASPRIFAALQRNLCRNAAQNVRPLNVAASGGPGVLRLYRAPDSNLGMTGITQQEGFEIEADVPADALGNLLEPEELKRARVVKIDVEGAEYSVLTGIGSLLKCSRPDLEFVVEVHPALLQQHGKTPEDVLLLLRRAGFHPYALTDQSILPNEYPARAAQRPSRLKEPIETEVTLVFSREDRESL